MKARIELIGRKEKEGNPATTLTSTPLQVVATPPHLPVGLAISWLRYRPSLRSLVNRTYKRDRSPRISNAFHQGERIISPPHEGSGRQKAHTFVAGARSWPVYVARRRVENDHSRPARWCHRQRFPRAFKALEDLGLHLQTLEVDTRTSGWDWGFWMRNATVTQLVSLASILSGRLTSGKCHTLEHHRRASQAEDHRLDGRRKV